MHEGALVLLLYCPGGQGVHDVGLLALIQLPGRHEKLEVHTPMPVDVVVVPDGHGTHCVLLYPGAY